MTLVHSLDLGGGKDPARTATGERSPRNAVAITEHHRADLRCRLASVTRVRPGGARFILAIAVLAIALAACGGSDSSDGDSDATDSTTTTLSGNGTTPTTADDSGSAFVAPVLAGTSWNVVLYELPTGGMTNLWPGTEITLSFSDDGTLSGFSGCNTYTGTHEVDGPYNEESDPFYDDLQGQAIRVSSLSWTERACTGPNNVMEQEGEFLSALGSAANWLINGESSLVLQGADGFFLLEAEPAT